MLHEFRRPPKPGEQTEHIMVTSLPSLHGGAIDIASVRRVWMGLGAVEVRIEAGKHHIVASFASVRDAERARSKMHCQPHEDRPGSRKWVAQFAQQAVPSVQQHELPNVPSRASNAPPGMNVYADVISEDDEQQLIGSLEAQGWSSLIGRKVQHYGWRFDYETRDVDRVAFPAPFPSFVVALLDEVLRPAIPHVFDAGWAPDQLTVNHYLPGQGIAPHVDTHSAFEDTIVSLSLGSSTVMDMRHEDSHLPVLLPRRSLAVLSGPARYLWRHGIAYRKTDLVDSLKRERRTRLSLTFRQVTV